MLLAGGTGIGVSMSERPNLVFNFMENMNLDNFCLTAIDRQGNPYVAYRTTSPAAERALRCFVEEWLDEQEVLAKGEGFLDRGGLDE